MRILIVLSLVIITFSSYSQCISGDCENGYGKYNCDCGYVYEGEFVNGEKVNGTLAKSDLVYTGEFKHDVANGKGVIKYKDGSWYEGTFLENLPDGYGTYYFPNGQKYIGQMKQGVFTGLGVQIFLHVDGSVVETQIGNFKNDQLSGMGITISDNGNIYFGEFSDGKYWGFGVYVFSNDQYAEAGEFRKMKLKQNVVLVDYPSAGNFGVKGFEVDNMLFHAQGDNNGNELEIEAVNSKGEKMSVYFNHQNNELFLSKFGSDSLGYVINIKGEISEASYHKNAGNRIQKNQ